LATISQTSCFTADFVGWIDPIFSSWMMVGLTARFLSTPPLSIDQAGGLSQLNDALHRIAEAPVGRCKGPFHRKIPGRDSQLLVGDDNVGITKFLKFLESSLDLFCPLSPLKGQGMVTTPTFPLPDSLPAMATAGAAPVPLASPMSTK